MNDSASKELIDKAVAVTGLKIEELAERMGYSTLPRVSKGEFPLPDSKRRHLIEIIRISELEAATGPNFVQSSYQQHRISGARDVDVTLTLEEEARYRTQKARLVPLLSFAQAGVMTIYEELPQSWRVEVATDCPDEKAFAVELRGDSMHPRFTEGAHIVVMPSEAVRNGCLCVALFVDDSVVFKIYHRAGELVRLSSYNAAFPPMEHHAKEFRWIWPVYEVNARVW